jgi:hypothetical protein
VKEENFCVEDFLARRQQGTGGDIKASGVRPPKRNAGCDRISFCNHLVDLTLIVGEPSAPDLHKLRCGLRAEWPRQGPGMSDIVRRDVLPELSDLVLVPRLFKESADNLLVRCGRHRHSSPNRDALDLVEDHLVAPTLIVLGRARLA